VSLASFDAELRLGAKAARLIGVDEAGRGPLAGPVVAAAVLLPADTAPFLGARDSKLLSLKKREELFVVIRERAKVSVAWAGARDIERLNILQATLLSMRRAVLRLEEDALVLVDGPHKIPRLPLAQRAVVDGDALSLSVACASIVAKVVRDRWMERLDRLHPGYGFSKHKGYGTREHQKALEKLGPSPIHRRTYEPVRRLLAAK
jgi:ribonuclease HII